VLDYYSITPAKWDSQLPWIICTGVLAFSCLLFPDYFYKKAIGHKRTDKSIKRKFSITLFDHIIKMNLK